MSGRRGLRRGWVRLGRNFAALRAHPSRRWAFQLVAAALGLVLASVHWAGIVAGGALVGVLSDTWRRAVLAGFAFGSFVWLGFVVGLAVPGGLETYLASGELLGVSAAIALGLGALGGLVRSMVP